MRRRQIRLGHDEDDDPMSVVSNLFDAAMVFAVANVQYGRLYRGKESRKAEHGDYFEEGKADRTLHSVEKSGRQIEQ